MPRPSHAAVRASPACDGEGGARARGAARVWPRARRRERAVVRRPESPAGKRRHDCVGPKSLRRPYGVSAGQRPALRCALRPGADRRSACGAALRASPPLQARQRAGGMQSRWEVTARSKGAAGARRKTDGKWPPRTASGGPPADACGVALRATGPFSVRCRTPSLKRAPAGSGRSRDRLKLRPQLLGGVRMAGLERLLARYPHPDAAAIWHSISFAAFAERRRGQGQTTLNFFLLAPPPAPSQRCSAEPPGAHPGGSLATRRSPPGRAPGGAAAQKHPPHPAAQRQE